MLTNNLLISAVGRVVGMSEEHQRFLSIFRCRQCDAVLRTALGLITAKFYAADRRRLTQLSGALFRADTAECPKCGHRWKMYGGSAAAAPLKIEVLDVTETRRSEEFFGEDRRVIDNSKSSAQLTRTFSFSKEWSKSCHLEAERALGEEAGLNIGAAELAGIKLSAEEKVRQTYAVSQELKEILYGGSNLRGGAARQGYDRRAMEANLAAWSRRSGARWRQVANSVSSCRRDDVRSAADRGGGGAKIGR